MGNIAWYRPGDAEAAMDARRVVEVLNSARSRELAVIIQYMEHHYVAGGLEGLPSLTRQGLGDMWVRSKGTGLTARLTGPPDLVVALKSIAKVEMVHAERFANRVTTLGGVPTVSLGDRCKASSVIEMLELDLAAEEEAVALYTEYMEVCRQEGDEESVTLFEEVLHDERSHSATFRRLLEGRRG
jgi:bacterioferritin